jgi:hypothetical protein
LLTSNGESSDPGKDLSTLARKGGKEGRREGGRNERRRVEEWKGTEGKGWEGKRKKEKNLPCSV